MTRVPHQTPTPTLCVALSYVCPTSLPHVCPSRHHDPCAPSNAYTHLMRGPSRQGQLPLPLGQLGVVLLAHETAVDEAVAVPWLQRVSAGDADEALDMVDAALGPVHHVAAGDALAAAHARAARTEQPENVPSTSRVSGHRVLNKHA